jgi:hypothetical protein
MHVRDLRREPPRRWNVEIDGIVWMPRLIDKTRAALAGTLGPYLFGQSPIDREFLHALGMSHRAFAEIVAASPDDGSVIAALAGRDPQALDRARAWSATLARRHGKFLALLDMDDGYAGGATPVVKPLMNALSFALTWTIKRIYPNRATEGLEQRW